MVVVLVLLSLGAARTVQAQTMETYLMTPAIQSLHACVQHVVDQGLIDNAGVATRLFAKLDRPRPHSAAASLRPRSMCSMHLSMP
jgi:hypothetical protein